MNTHDGSGETKTPTEARQAITPGVVRWVLAISLILVIVAFIVVFAAS